jgi:enamine deaminase RidA (YjgF/YER057c/UK114 family)
MHRQAKQTSAGHGPRAVVTCTCYLADLGDVSAFNAVYLEFFGAHRPARTTVQAQLIGGIGIEITAVVALPPDGLGFWMDEPAASLFQGVTARSGSS